MSVSSSPFSRRRKQNKKKCSWKILKADVSVPNSTLKWFNVPKIPGLVCIIGLTMVTHMIISREGPVSPTHFLAWLLSYCKIEKSIPEYSRHRIIKTCLVISFAADPDPIVCLDCLDVNPDPDQRKDIGSGSNYWFVQKIVVKRWWKSHHFGTY